MQDFTRESWLLQHGYAGDIGLTEAATQAIIDDVFYRCRGPFGRAASQVGQPLDRSPVLLALHWLSVLRL